MSRKTLGRATIRVNGQVFDSEPGASLLVGGLKNNARQTTETFYYNQTKIPSRLSCRVPVTADVSLRALQEITDAEITFEGDTGQTYIVRNAVQTGDVEVADGSDGGFAALVFEGDPAEEML